MLCAATFAQPTLRLLDPAERPALLSGQARVWLCRGETPSLRPTARALLREIVGSYLGIPAGRLPLHCMPGQAPRVDASWEKMPLTVSLSYAREAALVGLCAGASIGVDIVDIVPMPDWEAVSRTYLGPALTRRFAAIRADRRDRAFAQAWAELEARGKSLGMGLVEWSPGIRRMLFAPSVRVDGTHFAPQPVCCAVAVAPLTCATVM